MAAFVDFGYFQNQDLNCFKKTHLGKLFQDHKAIVLKSDIVIVAFSLSAMYSLNK